MTFEEGEADEEGDDREGEGEGERDHLHRALNPSAKEGGRAEKRCVWKVSV